MSSQPARDGETLSDEQFERLLDEYETAAVAWGNAREREIQRECDDDCAAKRAAIVAAVAALRAGLAGLVTAIDNELVTSGELGTFKLGDDPKAALHRLACWNQSVGAYFAARAASGEDASHE